MPPEEEIVAASDSPLTEAPIDQTVKTIFETAQFEGESLRMGQVLRRVREARGLELADVSASSLIRKNFLMAMERMETGEIPKGYLSVYLRTYAKALGIPADTLVERYTRECGAVDEVRHSAPVPKIGDIEPQKSNWPIAAAAAAVLVLLGGGAIMAKSMLSPDVELAPAPPVQAAVNGARGSLFDEASTRPLPTNLALELVAVRQGWLEVRGADGTIFLSRTLAKDETYFPRLDAGWTVSARDGGAFEWRVGDITVGPMGPEGAPVFSMSVDEQLVAAAEVASPAVASNGAAKPAR